MTAVGYKHVYLVSQGEHEDGMVHGIFSTFDRAYDFYKSISLKRIGNKRIIRYPLDYLYDWPNDKERDTGEVVIDSYLDDRERTGR